MKKSKYKAFLILERKKKHYCRSNMDDDGWWSEVQERKYEILFLKF